MDEQFAVFKREWAGIRHYQSQQGEIVTKDKGGTRKPHCLGG